MRFSFIIFVIVVLFGCIVGDATFGPECLVDAMIVICVSFNFVVVWFVMSFGSGRSLKTNGLISIVPYAGFVRYIIVACGLSYPCWHTLGI
jgi:hypothetical protein